MKRLVALLLVLVFCVVLMGSALAEKSNQGGGGDDWDDETETTTDEPYIPGDDPEPGTSPRTGAGVIAVLALTACAAGGVSVAAGKKARK